MKPVPPVTLTVGLIFTKAHEFTKILILPPLAPPPRLPSEPLPLDIDCVPHKKAL